MGQPQKSIPKFASFLTQIRTRSETGAASTWLEETGTVLKFSVSVLCYRLRCQWDRQLRLRASRQEELEEPQGTQSRYGWSHSDNNRITSFNELNRIEAENLTKIVLGNCLETKTWTRLHTLDIFLCWSPGGVRPRRSTWVGLDWLSKQLFQGEIGGAADVPEAEIRQPERDFLLKQEKVWYLFANGSTIDIKSFTWRKWNIWQ